MGTVVWAKVPGHPDPAWPGQIKAVKTVSQVSRNQMETYRNDYR